MPAGRLMITGSLMASMLLLGACRDDGRTLDPPTAPLPVTTVPASSLPAEEPVVAPMTLIAPWPDGAIVPPRNTCAGEGLSPALTWSGVPDGTLELAITVTDLDDGQAALWIVDALSPSRTGLTEGLVPEEGIERPNSAGVAAWQAPCPPVGENHRFQFTLHALNQQLEVADDASAAEVISLLNAIAIDQASITGTAARSE